MSGKKTNTHPLQQRVHAVGRQARRLVLLYGLGWFSALVLAAVLALGTADYVLRIQDPGVRWICSIAALLVAGCGVWRFVYPAWRYRPGELRVAQRLERRFPQLGDRLSSSLAFLRQPQEDPKAGSATLRRAVVAETTGLVEQLELSQVLDWRPSRRALAVAALLAGTVLAAFVWDGPAAVLAARRLAMPWSHEAWPRRNELALVRPPTRLAAGRHFEAAVTDRNGRLPERVTVYYWFEGDAPSEVQVRQMRPLGDQMVHRLDNVRRSFQVRAAGGDHHTMPWRRVEVVEPPQVESVELRLHAPEYTGWTVETSGEHLRALEGTRVEVRGRATRPLSAAWLKFDHPEGPAGLPLQLAPDGYGFSLSAQTERPWQIDQSGAYWFELQDRQGLKGGAERRWEIRAVPDQAPTVSLEKPASNVLVTAEAMVPLKAVVKDDLAIQRIELRYTRSDQSDQGEQTEVLYQGPDPPVSSHTGGLNAEGRSDDSQTPESVWDLSQFQTLKPGDAIEFSIVASDYKPQSSHSSSRRLTIISAEELEDRIAQRQGAILSELAEALRMQRETRSQTRSLEIQLQEAGHLGSRDIDQLQSSELNQRRVQRLLADPDEGLQWQIQGLLADLESNRVDSPEVARRMTELLAAVRLIGQQHLPAIERELIAALKSAHQALRDADELAAPQQRAAQQSEAAAQSLAEAGIHQDQVIATLEQLLGEYSQWDSYRRIAREISRLRRDQQEILQQTSDRMLNQETFGKDPRDLQGQDLADLKRLGQRQAELARQFDKLQGAMRQMQTRLEQSEPLAAETLADALDAARRLALGGQMRESGRTLQQNRIGQSAGHQQEVLQGLDELLDLLANRREHELGRVVRKLRQAAGQLQGLRGEQQGLRQQIDQAAEQADQAEQQRQLGQLAAEQQELAEQAQRLARRLERLQAQRAGQLTGQAGSQLDQAAQAAQQGQAPQAQQDARQGEQLLDDAQQQLDREIRQAEQDLLHEQLARLEEAIAGMIGRQQNLRQTTSELDALRRSQQDVLTRAQASSVRALGDEQQALGEEAGTLAEKLTQAESFQLALRGVLREMARAARALERLETGSPAQQPQQHALVRLEQLQTALLPDDMPPQAEQDAEAPPGQGDQPADAIHALAELKLVKLMQEEINRRTAQLEDLLSLQGELSEPQQRELDELAQEQGHLADLLFHLIGENSSNDQPMTKDQGHITNEK